MFSKLFIVMTAALVAVNAQGGIPIESGIPGLTPCIKACIAPAAAQNGCRTFTNVACLCTSAQFQADSSACLQQHCSAADVQTAAQILNDECTAAGLSASGSATAHPVSFTLPGPTSTTSSAPAATTTPPPS